MENVCCKSETAQIMDKEVVCEQARSSENSLFGINKLAEYLPNVAVSGLLPDGAKDSAVKERIVDKSDHDFGKTTATIASSNGELQVRKNVLVSKPYPETVAGTSNNLQKQVPSPKGSCSRSLNAGHNKGQGDRNSYGGLSYNVNARSSECYKCTRSDGLYNVNARSSECYKCTRSVESPSSDTPKSEISEWSSSCSHNHTDNQLDTLLYQSTNTDVGGVLEALRRAKMSLRKSEQTESTMPESVGTSST
jgi:hypothetical protein